MARFTELPAELVLHIVSFLTRETNIEVIEEPSRDDSYFWLNKRYKIDLVPDFSSVNALSRTNSVFHHTLDHTLYQLCTSVESLGRLAILFAVKHNLEAAFDKLVAAGVSVDAKFECEFWFTGRGLFSLLHIAAGMGSSLIVPKLLRIYGSETLERVHARGDRDMSALDYAALGGHIEIIKLLAPMAILAASSSSAITVDLSDERILAHKKYLGQALVKSAIPGPSGQKIAICEYLLSEGADVNTLDGGHASSLGYATFHDYLTTMRVLLAAGADPNLSHRDIVPLFVASNVPTAQALLDAGANIHATDNVGRNALTHRAFQNTKLLRFLLERGVDPNHADHKGRTPLHYACGQKASVELLIQFGATTAEKADTAGLTPAHLAMKMGMIEVVKLFEPHIQDPAFKAKISKWLKERGGLEGTGPTI